MGRFGGNCFSQFTCGLVAGYALVTWGPCEAGGAFPVVQSQANRLGVMCATLKGFKKKLIVREH